MSAIRFVGGLFTILLPVVFVLLLRNPVSLFADQQPRDAENRVPPSASSLTAQPLAAEPELAGKEAQASTATSLATERTVGATAATGLSLQPREEPQVAGDSLVGQQDALVAPQGARRKASKNRARRRTETARASAPRGALDEHLRADEQERARPPRRGRQTADDLIGAREFIDQHGVRYIIVPAGRRGSVEEPFAFADEFVGTAGRSQSGRR